ncbi:uncharacterized protein N7458_001142 [Penicillium daleae]|uniref:NAD(P)-binding domain-containing protein n=1 Tax=Penicillium daleae TaxID=63821 RepID=A0AAD6CCW7_9EURO|nr:uncharacterized protein N7458_001142 [Penicillium daleae]KAJ5459590.1 hypothetical protein N7458_001142 [Penicillium daleae]
MNIIIAGATGFVGGEIVRQAIVNDKINHAYILTRKPIPEELARSQKVTIIQHDDFSHYPSELLSRLQEAEGCLWALGGRASQFPDVDTARKVSVQYTLAAAEAFSSIPKGKKFKFVFLSGRFAEWDTNKRLFFMADTRRIKGEVEKGLCELADTNPGKLEVWVVRPFGIIPVNAGVMMKLLGHLSNFIDVDLLANNMIRIVSEGYPERIIENETLLAM